MKKTSEEVEIGTTLHWQLVVQRWIMRKKEQMEKKGKVVKASSKYTGRKRKITF